MTKPMQMTRIDSAQIVEVIRIETIEGKGVEGDVIRKVIYFCDPESGEVLARIDTMPQDGQFR